MEMTNSERFRKQFNFKTYVSYKNTDTQNCFIKESKTTLRQVEHFLKCFEWEEL